MSVTREKADFYQGLFNHLSEQHHLTLTISEMDEIIKLSLNTVSAINSREKLDPRITCHKRCGNTTPSGHETGEICLNCGSSIIRFL